jgi:hypothetical protein
MALGLRPHRSHIVFVLLWLLIAAQLPIGAFVEDPFSVNPITVEAMSGQAAVVTAVSLPPVVPPAASVHAAVTLSPLPLPADIPTTLRL